MPVLSSQPLASRSASEAQQLPPPVVKGFLVAIIILVLFHLVINALDWLSNRLPTKTFPLYAKIVCLFLSLPLSLVIGLVMFLYGVIENFFEVGSYAATILVGIGASSSVSFTTSSNLRKIVLRIHKFNALPSAAKHVLPSTLKNLILLASNRNLPNHLQFNQRCDFVLLCLQLNRVDLLDKFLSSSACNSLAVCLRLQQLHRRVQDVANLELFPDAFSFLASVAFQEPSSDTLPFELRTELVMYGLRAGDAELLNALSRHDLHDASSSPGSLRQLLTRLPPPSCLSEESREHLPRAVLDLLKISSNWNSPSDGIPFDVKVQLVMLFVKLCDPKMLVSDSDQDNVALAVTSAEATWIRQWVSQFLSAPHLLESTQSCELSPQSAIADEETPGDVKEANFEVPQQTLPANTEDQYADRAVRLVAAVYGLLKTVRHLSDDVEHSLRVYEWCMRL